MNYNLEIINFTKTYKRSKTPAVNNISFNVPKGSFYGLIGANGSGKTTTIKSIIGAFVNFEGEIKIGGTSNKKIDSKDQVGYIPEVANFPSGLNAERYLFHMAHLSGMNKEEAKKRVSEVLEKFGMAEFAKKKPTSFSSGQKKKILLAQAMIHDPKIIIMDEPAANLDPKARKDFFDSLKKLNKEGKTIFITSHILAELDDHIDSATILDEGQIVFSGTLEDIKKTSEFVIEFQDSKEVKTIEKVLSKHKYKIEGNNIIISIEGDIKATKKDIISKVIAKVQPQAYYIKERTLNEIYNQFAASSKKIKKEKSK